MTSPQKAKGSGYERETAKFLSELYGESFIRAPGSGAYIGGSNNHRKQYLHESQVRGFKGDIIPGESFPRLNAECKFYKDFPFHQLFTGGVKILDTWIEQCLDAADEGDFNIIFMKFNRKGTYVAVQTETTSNQNTNTTLNNTETTSKQTTETSSKLNLKSFIEYKTEKFGTWIFMDHDTFFSQNAQAVKGLCA